MIVYLSFTCFLIFLLSILLNYFVNDEEEKVILEGEMEEDEEGSKVGGVKKLPVPPFFPLLGGNLIYIIYLYIKFKDPFKIFAFLTKKYGKIVNVKFWSNNFILVEDEEIARELLTSEMWSRRLPNSRILRARSFDKKLGIIFNNDDSWREARRFTTKTLGHFGFGKKSMETIIKEELTEFLSFFEMVRNEGNGIVSIKEKFTPAILNIIWGLIANDRFNYDDPQLIDLIDGVFKASKSEPVFGSITWIIPQLRGFKLYEKTAMMQLHFKLQNFLRGIINDRKARGCSAANPEDFIDNFLEEQTIRRGSIYEQFYTEEQLIMICLDLFISGSETIANTLEFALLFMIKYPEIQERLFTEIQSTIGLFRLPTLEDRKRMPFQEAFFLELLRFVNILPMTIRTPINDECTVKGVPIPKISSAFINLRAIHNNKDVWGDPHLFKPERFLDASQTKVINRKKIMPFGFGTRICIGEIAANLTFYLFFTSLVQRYSFHQLSSQPPSFNKHDYGFSNSVYPFNLKVNLR